MHFDDVQLRVRASALLTDVAPSRVEVGLVAALATNHFVVFSGRRRVHRLAPRAAKADQMSVRKGVGRYFPEHRGRCSLCVMSENNVGKRIHSETRLF